MGLEYLACQRRAEDNLLYKLRPVRVLLLIILLLVYLMVGAGIFVAIEQAKEKLDRKSLTSIVEAFVKSHESCVSKSQIEQLVTYVSQAAERGIKWTSNQSLVTTNWNYGQSFFFCGTLISTVGYGQISPSTASGKAFTIFYCIFGIPLFLTFLSVFVDRLRTSAYTLRDWIGRRFGGSADESRVRYIHLGAIGSAVFVFLFLVPAGIFQSIEKNWSYLDSFYYCFISLTTIGLGDYVPGGSVEQPLGNLYNIVTTGYLIVGLIGMMLLLSVFYDTPELSLRRLLVDDSCNAYEKEYLRVDPTAKTNYTRQIDEDFDKALPMQCSAQTITADADYGY